MGKQQSPRRKHLFLHGACLLAFLLFVAGCRTVPVNHPNECRANEHLDRADHLVKQGKYRAAIEEYHRVEVLFPHDSPGDIALFRMGVLWAHPDNEQRSDHRALECLRRLERQFPQSTWKEEGKAIKNMMNELAQNEKKCKKTEEKIMELEEKIRTYQDRLNALKKIDIDIEERKRNDSPKKSHR